MNGKNKKLIAIVGIAAVLVLAALLVYTLTAQKDFVYESEDYGFRITIPKEWDGKYRIADNNGNGITIINVSNENAGWGGTLGYINVVEAAAFRTDIVRTVEIARTAVGNLEYVYALYYPSDVNYFPQDEALTAEYFAMQEELEGIALTLELT